MVFRRLGFKAQVITDHMVTQAMGLQPVTIPDTGHRHVSGSQFPDQTPAASLRGAFVRSTPRILQNASFQLEGIFCCRPTLMSGNQARQAVSQKAISPALDVRRAATHGGRRSSNTYSRSQRQDRVRPPGIFRPDPAQSNPAVEYFALLMKEVLG